MTVARDNQMATVGIVAKQGSERARELAVALAELSEEAGASVTLDAVTAEGLGWTGVPVAELGTCDLLVSIGGDGTLLFAAREAGAVPIIGVDLGEVGFVNAVAPENAHETITALVRELVESGSVPTEERLRVRASGAGWDLAPALNEITVMGPHRGPGTEATLSVAVDGDEYLESRADGVLVATPTGSTAYTLAEGGPVLEPGADVLAIVPLAPATPRPPLVVDADRTVTVSIAGPTEAVAIGDGRNRQSLSPPATVTVETAPPLPLAGPSVDQFGELATLPKG